MRHAELQEHYLASRVGRNHKSNLRRAVLRSPDAQRVAAARGWGSGIIIVRESTLLVGALRTAKRLHLQEILTRRDAGAVGAFARPTLH